MVGGTRSKMLAVGVAALSLVACRHVPSEKEQQGAQIHYDLGVQAQQSGSVQAALQEYQEALKLDPNFPDAHNALGLLMHLSFNKPDDAIKHYREAIKVRPTFSEAKTNLGNVYLDQHRYDDAIGLYEQALNDMLYPTPFIAQGNLGWALYKKGDVTKGLEQIKAAVTTNPKFCLGYKNLGLIQEEQGQVADACRQFGRYRENCPEVAEAYLREGTCLAKLGRREEALDRLKSCEEKSSAPMMKDECHLYRERLQ